METSYIIKSVELETVCGITSTFPENENIEIAFAGKSNVGKSSLINAYKNNYITTAISSSCLLLQYVLQIIVFLPK